MLDILRQRGVWSCRRCFNGPPNLYKVVIAVIFFRVHSIIQKMKTDTHANNFKSSTTCLYFLENVAVMQGPLETDQSQCSSRLYFDTTFIRLSSLIFSDAATTDYINLFRFSFC